MSGTSPDPGEQAAHHSPCLVDVDALVGGAGGRRLCEGGGGEDALRPGVHCGLKEQRDSEGGGHCDDLRLQDKHRLVAAFEWLQSHRKGLWAKEISQGWMVLVENFPPNVTL